MSEKMLVLVAIGSLVLAAIAHAIGFVRGYRRGEENRGGMVLRGKAARTFLADMDKPVTPEKKAFLEQCAAEYRKSREKRVSGT